MSDHDDEKTHVTARELAEQLERQRFGMEMAAHGFIMNNPQDPGNDMLRRFIAKIT